MLNISGKFCLISYKNISFALLLTTAFVSGNSALGMEDEVRENTLSKKRVQSAVREDERGGTTVGKLPYDVESVFAQCDQREELERNFNSMPASIRQSSVDHKLWKKCKVRGDVYDLLYALRGFKEADYERAIGLMTTHHLWENCNSTEKFIDFIKTLKTYTEDEHSRESGWMTRYNLWGKIKAASEVPILFNLLKKFTEDDMCHVINVMTTHNLWEKCQDGNNVIRAFDFLKKCNTHQLSECISLFSQSTSNIFQALVCCSPEEVMEAIAVLRSSDELDLSHINWEMTWNPLIEGHIGCANSPFHYLLDDNPYSLKVREAVKRLILNEKSADRRWTILGYVGRGLGGEDHPVAQEFLRLVLGMKNTRESAWMTEHNLWEMCKNMNQANAIVEALSDYSEVDYTRATNYMTTHNLWEAALSGDQVVSFLKTIKSLKDQDSADESLE